MGFYIVRRVGNAGVVLLGLTVFLFALLRLAPGSPVYLLAGENATQAQIRELSHQLGFDQPLYVQYGQFLADAVHGDLGISLAFQSPAASLVLERLPATIELTICATLLTLVVSVPLGVVMAVRRGRWADRVSMLFTTAGVSTPSFWLGTMLIIVFAVAFKVFAISGRGEPLTTSLLGALEGDFATLTDTLRHLALPTVTLAAFEMAFLARMTRSAVLEELGQTYVRAAAARGLPRPVVITKYVLRNAILPVVTVLGLEIGTLIGGAVITEAVFGWPGVGQLIFQAVTGRDYPLAQAGILMIGVFVVAINLIVDLTYGALDPRVKYR